MERENRSKITVWLKPDVVQRMDGWLKADNCKSRGEFTEKALRFYMGYLATEDTSVFLSRTSLFAEMAVLLPYVRGRRGLGFALWSLGTTVFVAALTLLLAGCLGPYAATQDFPVYTLASLSEVASLQRLEPVFAVLWMAGLLPQVAMGLYACRVCAASLGGNRPPWVIVPAALGMAALGLWAVSSKGVQSAFQDSSPWLTLTLLTGGGVPLVLWLLNKLRRKGARP